MTEGKDLLGPLREADRELSRATLAPRTRQRIEDRLADASDAAAARGHGKRRVVLAVAAAAVIAFAAWARQDRGERDDRRPPASGRVAGFAWRGDACRAADRAGALVLDGTCRAEVDELGIAISSRGAAELVRVEAGVRLVGGTAEFQVEHVAADHPVVRVAVSAGVIEVTGTRFTVVEEPGRGHVDLHEGRIQFRAADDTLTAVEPGRRLVWVAPKREVRGDHAAAAAPAAPASIHKRVASEPAAAAALDEPTASPSPAPRDRATRAPAIRHSAIRQPAIRRQAVATAPAPAASARSAAPPPTAPPPAATALPPPPVVPVPTHLPDQAAASLIDRVLALRAERRYREAADLLRQASRQNWRPSTAELLSYEEGDIRARLPDRAAACDHWRRHRTRFPAALHAAAIEKSMKRLGCR
ncbi:MAG TPA: FecR domain-containing protein [Kofleriaceae bacterium]|nr:FecR domain-containing protein [Kofleriaceae bacterium]